MSEITVHGTRRQIVINEAVDLAKRFCDGAAPRIVNGCLRTFVNDSEGTSPVQDLNLSWQLQQLIYETKSFEVNTSHVYLRLEFWVG